MRHLGRHQIIACYLEDKQSSSPSVQSSSQQLGYIPLFRGSPCQQQNICNLPRSGLRQKICNHLCRWAGIVLPSCSVGYSGILFALIVADHRVRGTQQRSIFGVFIVPAAYFSWILLILCQILLPQTSFFGHLGGILAGMLYASGWLDWSFPSAASLQVLHQALALLTMPYCGCSGHSIEIK